MWLIAYREVTENLRTKGFWLSLAMLPLVLLISASIPALVQTTTPRLSFSVIDPSGWMNDALQARSLANDFTQLLSGLRAQQAISLPAELKGLSEAVINLDDIEIETLATALSTIDAPLDKTLMPLRSPLLSWWAKQNSDSLPDWLRSTSQARFQWEDGSNATEAQLLERLREGTLFAYIVLPFDPIAGDEQGRYVSDNLTNRDLLNWFTGLANATLRARRIEEESIRPETVRWIERPLQLDSVSLTAESVADVSAGDVLSQWLPALLAYLLWMSVFAGAQMLLTSTMEEKSSKLSDVILTSVSAESFLAGKVLGVAATTALVALVWILASWLFVGFFPGLSPEMRDQIVSAFANPLYAATFLLYFVLGYLLLSTTIAGLGALTPSLRDAQNLLMPIQFGMMVPLVAILPIARDPDGPLAQILTWIPPFTPFVMMNRAANPPSIWIFAGTTILLLLCIRWVWRFAARSFEQGLLNPESTLRLREFFRFKERTLAPVDVTKDSPSSIR